MSKENIGWYDSQEQKENTNAGALTELCSIRFFFFISFTYFKTIY